MPTSETSPEVSPARTPSPVTNFSWSFDSPRSSEHLQNLLNLGVGPFPSGSPRNNGTARTYAVAVAVKAHEKLRWGPFIYALRLVEQRNCKISVICCMTKVRSELGIDLIIDGDSFGAVSKKKLEDAIEAQKKNLDYFLQSFRTVLEQKEIELEINIATGRKSDDILVQAATTMRPHWVVLDVAFTGSQKKIQAALECNLVLLNKNSKKPPLRLQITPRYLCAAEQSTEQVSHESVGTVFDVSPPPSSRNSISNGTSTPTRTMETPTSNRTTPTRTMETPQTTPTRTAETPTSNRTTPTRTMETPQTTPTRSAETPTSYGTTATRTTEAPTSNRTSPTGTMETRTWNRTTPTRTTETSSLNGTTRAITRETLSSNGASSTITTQASASVHRNHNTTNPATPNVTNSNTETGILVTPALSPITRGWTLRQWFTSHTTPNPPNPTRQSNPNTPGRSRSESTTGQVYNRIQSRPATLTTTRSDTSTRQPNTRTAPAPAPSEEIPYEVALAMAIEASIASASEQGIPVSPSAIDSSFLTPLAPSAPPLPVGGPIRYPSVDTSPAVPLRYISTASSNDTGTAERRDGDKSCVVCWDAPAEAACIPCGHLVGCKDCLTEIKSKKRGCPMCRASITQVLKVYAVY